MTPRNPWRRRSAIGWLWLLVASSLIGAALGAAAHSHASPGGFYAVGNAATVCAVLDAQPTFSGLTELMSDIGKTTRLSDAEIGGAVALSVIHVCPHHRKLLQQYVTAHGTKGSNA